MVTDLKQIVEFLRYLCMMKMRQVFTFLFLLVGMGQAMAQKFTISGYVKDGSDGEGIIGANVYVKELKVGTSANTYGFYSLTLAPGTYTLIYTSTGYTKVEKHRF